MNRRSNNKKTLAREYAFKYLYQAHYVSLDADAINVPHISPEPPKKKRGKKEEEEKEELISDFDRTYYEIDSEHPNNSLDTSTKDFAESLIKGILRNEEALKSEVSKYLKRWKIDTLDKVELTILTIGAYELMFIKDTPQKVVINECINLAKQFGTVDSFSFVNGILDKLAKSL